MHKWASEMKRNKMKWKQKEENFRKWNTDRHRYLPDVCTHTLYVHNVLSQNESCTDSHFSRLSVCLSFLLSFCLFVLLSLYWYFFPSIYLFSRLICLLLCPLVSLLIFLYFCPLLCIQVFSVSMIVSFSFLLDVCVHSNCISHLPWKKFKSKCGKNINESRWHFNHYRSFSVNVISSNFGSLFKYLNVSVYTSWRRGER